MRISDWSSDVCSSDLTLYAEMSLKAPEEFAVQIQWKQSSFVKFLLSLLTRRALQTAELEHRLRPNGPAIASQVNRVLWLPETDQIGRASCRARVCQYV